MADNAWLGAFQANLALRRRYLADGAAQARSLGAAVLADDAVRAGWQLPGGQWWLAFNLGTGRVAASLPDGDTVLALGDVDATGMLAPGAMLVRWVAQ